MNIKQRPVLFLLFAAAIVGSFRFLGMFAISAGVVNTVVNGGNLSMCRQNTDANATHAVAIDAARYVKWGRAAAPVYITGVKGDVLQPYGTENGTVSLSGLHTSDGYNVALQWYRNDQKTPRGATLVATKSNGTLSYTIPADTPIGTYYYYCVATGTRKDNGAKIRACSDCSDYMAVTIIKARQEAPKAHEGYEINYRKETIEINDGYEVYTAETDGKELLSGERITGYLGKAVYIRKAEKALYHASDWTKFYITPRRLPPPVRVKSESARGKGDGAITGITKGMEYKEAGDAGWTAGPAELKNLPAGAKVQVRFAATDKTPHGKVKLCIIQAGGDVRAVTYDAKGDAAVSPGLAGLSDRGVGMTPSVSYTLGD